MLKIVFLCSGNGGNLRFIAEAIRLGWLKNAKLIGVITDRECLANQFAREHGIWTKEINFLEQEQHSLINALAYCCADIIITNVHRILVPAVVNSFKGRLLNLHYSLLPAFSGTIGTTPIKMSLAYGVKFVGTTFHHVVSQVDQGLPIVQTVIPVKQEDTVDDLMDTVFRAGCISLLNGIEILHENTPENLHDADLIKISGRNVFINPMRVSDINYQSEYFWNTIKCYPKT